MNTPNEQVAPEEAARRLKLKRLVTGQTKLVLIATTAFHGSSDISRHGAPAQIHGETENDWIGQWMEGFGLCNVRFPKSGCRNMTEAEVSKIEACTLSFCSPLEAASSHVQILSKE